MLQLPWNIDFSTKQYFYLFIYLFIYSACSITISNTTCSCGFLHIHFLSTMISYLLNLHVCDW